MWRGPGLLPDGTPAYDSHGWMHGFDFMAEDAYTCQYLSYRARRLMPAASLPVSFFTVRLGSLRDCSTLHCLNFTDYNGDVLVRLLREHRVNASLGVTTEDDLPLAAWPPSMLADAAERFGAVSLVTRRVGFSVVVRQPHLLPLTSVFTMKYGGGEAESNATLGGRACDLSCAEGAPAPRPDLCELSVPWTLINCTALCEQPVTSMSFADSLTSPGGAFEATIPVADAGGSLLTGAPLALSLALPPRPVASQVSVALALACTAAGACSATAAAPGWDVALQAAYAVAAAAQPTACSPGGASFGVRLAANATFAVDVSASPSGAPLWACAVATVTRAAGSWSFGSTLPTFSTASTAALFSAGGVSPMPDGRWAASAPIWNDGSLLTPACAANASCASGYPYLQQLAPAVSPLTLFSSSPIGKPLLPPPRPAPKPPARPSPPPLRIPAGPPFPVGSSTTSSSDSKAAAKTYLALVGAPIAPPPPRPPAPPGSAGDALAPSVVALAALAVATTALLSTWRGNARAAAPSATVSAAVPAPAPGVDTIAKLKL